MCGILLIDTALSRMMQRFRVGAFDPKDQVSYRNIGTEVLDSSPHQELALQSAQQAIVLLENNGGTLPLSKTKGLTVAMLGPMANNSAVMIGGKRDYHASHIVTLLEGVTDKMRSFGSHGSDIEYAQGSSVNGKPEPDAVAQAVALAVIVDVSVICVGIDASIEHEGTDRTTIGLPPTQLSMLQAVTAAANKAHKKVVVVLVNGGPLSVDWLKREHYSAKSLH